jgi:prevent-host-death family protein
MTRRAILVVVARPYPVHEAKAKLSEILRRVKRGRSVSISERGREIAQVVPIARTTDLATRLAELERDGLIRRSRGSIKTITPLARKRGALARFLASRG